MAAAGGAKSTFYEEKDLLAMDFNEDEEKFTAPCPCGDKFFITVDALIDNEERAECASCSLVLKVHYDPDAVRQRFIGDDSQHGADGDDSEDDEGVRIQVPRPTLSAPSKPA